MNKLFLGIAVGVVAYVVYDHYTGQPTTTTTTTTNDKQPDHKRMPVDGCCYNVAVRGGLINRRKLSVA